MMTNNESNRQSQGVQTKQEDFIKRADILFSLGWLRSMVWSELQKRVADEESCSGFCSAMQQDHWLQFVFDFLKSHQSTLHEYKSQYENQLDNEDFVMSLFEERKQLIGQFVNTKPSSWWEILYKGNREKSMPRFANRLYSLDDDQRYIFFTLLDRLGILTDLICHRDSIYDMELDYTKYKEYAERQRTFESGSKEITPEQLKRAVEACKDYFYSQTAWAVVYALCVEEYGFDRNKASFERFIQSLKADVEKGCPNGTIQSAETSSPFFKQPISEWRELHAPERVFTLLDNLRTELDKLA